MYTKEGRFFTGHKTFWRPFPEKSGRVDVIEVSVKAFDNEGRSFQGEVVTLTLDQVKRSITGIKGHQEVIDELVTEVYARGCDAEVVASLDAIDAIIKEDVEDERREQAAGFEGQVEARQDRQDEQAPEVEGSGDKLADG